VGGSRRSSVDRSMSSSAERDLCANQLLAEDLAWESNDATLMDIDTKEEYDDAAILEGRDAGSDEEGDDTLVPDYCSLPESKGMDELHDDGISKREGRRDSCIIS